MTDKELAEKYEEKIDYIEVNDDGKKIYDSIDIQQAYIAGLKTGRKEKWHDLRKDQREIFFESNGALKWHKKGYIDNEANEMHEAVVKEISDNLAKGWLYED